MGVLRKPVVLKRGKNTVKTGAPSEITALKAAGYAVVEDAPKPAQDKPAQAKPDVKKN